MVNDASELMALGNDLRHAGDNIMSELEKVTFKGAMNVKQGMLEQLQDSTHFKSISRSVDFDIDVGPDGVEAEIGPRHGPGEPGNLANVAYFGTSRGGGTVDFMKPFEEEKPRFEKAIGDVAKNVL